MKTALNIIGALLLASYIYYKLTNKTKERGMTIKNKEVSEKKGAKVLPLRKYLKYYHFKGRYKKAPAIQ